MDELTTAILNAANELRTDYGWSVDDYGGSEEPKEYGEFVRVLHKHISPLLDSGVLDAHRRAKVLALRQEADALEALLTPNDESNRTPRGAGSQGDDGCRRSG
jgi:hypothetical protein